MSRTLRSAAIAVAIIAAAGGGYLAGRDRNPASVEAHASAAATPQAERRILYYRNPMGLADTSPMPKKDPMGMDYVPVYAGETSESAASNRINVSAEKIQKLGVRTEPAAFASLDRIVSAAGRVEPDERRVYTVAPKFEGYVEHLRVNATGQPVGRGQPLFEVYSPELVSAQHEYAIAAKGIESLKGADGEVQLGIRQLAEASLTRLRNWDVSEEQIKTLASSGEAKRTLTFRSPVAGIVTEKKAVQGMRFMPGEPLYQIADLSSVWVVADVFEQDIRAVALGAKARVTLDAYPDKTFEGTISYVYPTLRAETRSVPVRIDLANPGMLFKPGMYARVELRTAAKAPVLTVPASAVIDSGVRRMVFVDAGAGHFEPREVKLGARSGDRVEVLEGVREGESVVVAANFLIDAESNLQAAVGSFGHANHGAAVRDGTQGSAVGHKAAGRVEDVDAKAGSVTIAHDPVTELNWPAMTMEFKVANAALLKDLQPGTQVSFEFVERAPGEWLITQTTLMPATARHAGH